MDLLTYMQRYEPDNLIYCGSGEYRLQEHGSLVISNGSWNWFKMGRFGGRSAVDYLAKVRGMDFYDAARYMLDLQGQTPVKAKEPSKKWIKKSEKPKKEFILPLAHSDNKQADAYLVYRCIDREIINHCIESGSIYESVRGNYHNCVFVGRDEKNVPRFAAQRGIGTDFKRDVAGSDKRYNFTLTPSKKATYLCVFESPIDAMSYATLIHKVRPGAWKGARYLSLGGVSSLALEQYLRANPDIQEISLMLDNDEAGKSASKKIKGELEAKGYYVTDIPPTCGKDYNEELKVRLRAMLNIENKQKQIRPKQQADLVR